MINDNFIGIIFILGSIPCFIVFIRIIVFYLFTIKKWKTTEGVVLLSEPYYHNLSDPDSSGWKAKIIYEYSVDGNVFQSDQISRNTGTLVPWNEWVDMNDLPRKGEQIEVYYDPENPKIALIDNKLGYGILAYFAVGILAIIVGLNV